MNEKSASCRFFPAALETAAVGAQCSRCFPLVVESRNGWRID